METADDQVDKVQQDLENKRPNFFQRLRRSFTNIFRRRNNRKRSKSDSQVAEKQESILNPGDAGNLNSSLPGDEASDVNNEIIDLNERSEAKFKPPTKSPLPVNDFTSELKQSLQLRSRKIEEGDKSPTDAIKQIEGLRVLSSIVNEEKENIKIEIETKTFEEKLALFESQISGGSGSVPDTLKRNQGNGENGVDGGQDFVGTCDGEVSGEVRYTIDVLDHNNEDMKEEEDKNEEYDMKEREENMKGREEDEDKKGEEVEEEDKNEEEEDGGIHEINECGDHSSEPMTNGDAGKEGETIVYDGNEDDVGNEVREFVKRLIEDASEAIITGSDVNTVATGSGSVDVQ